MQPARKMPPLADTSPIILAVSETHLTDANVSIKQKSGIRQQAAGSSQEATVRQPGGPQQRARLSTSHQSVNCIFVVGRQVANGRGPFEHLMQQ